jgi:uncharacterized repeat protein (TIGR01451 family)
MNNSHRARHTRRALTIGLLLGSLSLFAALILLTTAPLGAAPEASECYATGNGGGAVHHSTDSAEALRSAIADALNPGTVWVAGTCSGAIEEMGTTQVARIAKNLTIIGYQYDGDNWTYDPDGYAVIDAQGGGRVFYVQTAGPVTFRNLHMVNGQVTGSGGAIYTSGVVAVENSLLEDNHSTNMGGAIASFDDLTISNSQLISNTAVHHGGAVAARGSGNDLVTLANVEFSKNRCTNAGGCFGGALSALHAVTMSDSSFTDNHTTGAGFASGGGAIYTVGELTIDSSHFADNTTPANGGALYAHDQLTVTSSEFVDNSAAIEGGAIWTAGTATLTGSNLTGNIASSGTSRGGGILNNGALTISASEVYSNSAYSGGGIFNTTSSVLSIGDGSEVRWNQANSGFGSGGGVRNEGTLSVADSLFSDNRGASGGAISTNGTLQLQQSELANNEARSGGAISHGAGTTTIAGATFSGNRSTAGPNQFEQPGGGAIALSLGQVSVTGSSFTGNQAAHRGGAIYNSASFAATLVVQESEITGNTAAYGGGLYVREDTTVVRSRLFDNTATDGGAMVITAQADVVLTNNFLAGNDASNRGDTLYFDNIGTQAGTLTAIHNTFVGTGSGTALATNGQLAGYQIALTNAIVSGYGTAIHTVGVTDTVAINGVLWHDVTTKTTGPGITVNNAYEGDPSFLDPANHDYHITPGSEALDNGVTTAVVDDIDGDERPQGAGPDLGADEVTVFLPDLTIRKTAAPANPQPGSLVTYELTFRNAGIGVMEDVVVSDVLPDSLEVVSVTATGVTIPPGTATTWNVGDLAAGEGGTITVVARVLTGTSIGTDITNSAEISGIGEEFTDINNTSSVTVTVANYKLYLPLIMK